MLKAKPAPTFMAPVEIPVPGGKPEKVAFEFKYRNTEELADFGRSWAGRPAADVVMDMVLGWDGIDIPFSAEGVAEVLKNYGGAFNAITAAYARELIPAALGN